MIQRDEQARSVAFAFWHPYLEVSLLILLFSLSTQVDSQSIGEDDSCQRVQEHHGGHCLTNRWDMKKQRGHVRLEVGVEEAAFLSASPLHALLHDVCFTARIKQ